MNSDPFLVFRVVSGVLFILTILAGLYLVKNYSRLFGTDSEVPSENGSSRAYSKVQIFTVWAHAFVLTGCGVLLLH